MIANRFFFDLNNHDNIEQSITATGYTVIARTKDTLYTLNPLSKLINDKPQIASQGINESAYNTWLIIKYSFIASPLALLYFISSKPITQFGVLGSTIETSITRKH